MRKRIFFLEFLLKAFLVFCSSVNLIALTCKNIWFSYDQEKGTSVEITEKHTFLFFSTFGGCRNLYDDLMQTVFLIKCTSFTDPKKTVLFNSLNATPSASYFNCFVNHKQCLSFSKSEFCHRC